MEESTTNEKTPASVGGRYNNGYEGRD